MYNISFHEAQEQGEKRQQYINGLLNEHLRTHELRRYASRGIYVSETHWLAQLDKNLFEEDIMSMSTNILAFFGISHIKSNIRVFPSAFDGSLLQSDNDVLSCLEHELVHAKQVFTQPRRYVEQIPAMFKQFFRELAVQGCNLHTLESCLTYAISSDSAHNRVPALRSEIEAYQYQLERHERGELRISEGLHNHVVQMRAECSAVLEKLNMKRN